MRGVAKGILAGFLLVGLFVGVSAPPADGQTVPAPRSGGAATGSTLQAELLQSIDASRAKAGEEVTARTITPLEFGGEKFPLGTMVIGHVTQAEPSRLVVDHVAMKKNARVPVGLSVRAVMMPKSENPSNVPG